VAASRLAGLGCYQRDGTGQWNAQWKGQSAPILEFLLCPNFFLDTSSRVAKVIMPVLSDFNAGMIIFGAPNPNRSHSKASNGKANANRAPA
jgi:hypothetical protein